MAKKIFTICALLVSQFGYAAEEAKPDASESGITVDESNFKAIFSESVEEVQHEVLDSSNSVNLEVRGSYSSFSAMKLSNSFFTVDYAEELSSIPSIEFVGSKRYRAGSFGLEPLVSVGYGTREAYVNVRSSQNVALKDYVSVHSLPIGLGLRASRSIPGLPAVTAFVTPSLGAQFVYQSGKLDGINQGFWIPNVSARAGLSFFESNRESRSLNEWLDGIVLSGAILRSLSSEPSVQAWSVDLGLRVLL